MSMEPMELRLPDLERHLERQMRSLERQLALVRLAVAALSALFVVAFRDGIEGFEVLLGIIAGVVVYNLVIGLLLRRFPAREVGIVAIGLDMVAVTLAVYFAAGALDIYLFYGIVILEVALRFGFGASVWSALVVSFLYLSVVLLASDAGSVVRDLLPVRLAYLVGIGFAAGLFSRVVLGRATENARLSQQLAAEERDRRRIHERELLSQLGREFGSSLERETAASAIVLAAAPLLGDVTWLYLVDESDDCLRLAGVEGRDPALAVQLAAHLAGRAPRLGEGICGGAAAIASPTLAGPEPPASAAPGDPDGVAALSLRSVLAVPIVSRRAVRGVLASATVAGEFGEDQRRLAEAIAERAGPALENAALWADLQERMAAEQHSQRVKDDFLSIVSHELRTPLTSIQGYSQLLEARLRGTAAPNSKELAQLRVIRSQVGRMRRLVDDLLDVSRIDRLGTVSIEPAPMDLAEALRELVARTAREEEARSITLDAPAELVVEADRDRIEQVLANLVENAIKYSPDGGPVSVRARVEGDMVAVSVADSGVGIPAELADLVFERFYQADSDVSRRRFGGLGLGLYVTRAIVEAHGGSIRAEPNRTAGRGTVFSFRIPLRIRPDLRSAPSSSTGEPPSFVLRRHRDPEP